MGQYYHPTLLDEQYKVDGWLYSHSYNHTGLKLMEHSYMGVGFVNAVLAKIKDNPMRVAWIGDYSTEPWSGKEPYQNKIPKEQFEGIFDKVYGDNDDNCRIHPEPLEGFDKATDYNGWFLVNHTRRSYVDLGEFQRKNGWQEEWGGEKHWCSIHPLPLLTACGNDRGGGDYHDCYPDCNKCGLWAFDLIEFSKSAPFSFDCEQYRFKEEE